METVIILNKADRGFYCENGLFVKPKSKQEVSAAIAKKLTTLYPLEVETLETAAKAFEQDVLPAAPTEPTEETAFDASKLKVAELKEIIEAAGYEVPEGALKGDLVALVEEIKAAEQK